MKILAYTGKDIAGPAKHMIQDYLYSVIGIVGVLLENGVPENIVHELLPQALYKQLHKNVIEKD